MLKYSKEEENSEGVVPLLCALSFHLGLVRWAQRCGVLRLGLGREDDVGRGCEA